MAGSAAGGDPPAPTKTQVGQLMLVLMNYLTAHVPRHPVLMGQVDVLERAADRYSTDPPAAFALARICYEAIVRARNADPSLPEP